MRKFLYLVMILAMPVLPRSEEDWDKVQKEIAAKLLLEQSSAGKSISAVLADGTVVSGQVSRATENVVIVSNKTYFANDFDPRHRELLFPYKAVREEAARQTQMLRLRAEQVAAAETKARQEKVVRVEAEAQRVERDNRRQSLLDSTGTIVVAIIFSTLVLAVLVWLFRILKAVIGLPGQMRAMRAAKVQDFLNKVRTERGLAPIACSNILKAGENAYFSEEAELFETQAVREHRSFRTGFRIAKGVYVGNSFGRSKSRQEWTKLDTGILTITNERLIYGGSQARTVPLTKIVSVEGNHDAVAVSVEGRAKTMVFKTPNNAILSMILRICCAVDDPGNIPELPMEIEAP